jgi:hypothetical protein
VTFPYVPSLLASQCGALGIVIGRRIDRTKRPLIGPSQSPIVSRELGEPCELVGEDAPLRDPSCRNPSLSCVDQRCHRRNLAYRLQNIHHPPSPDIKCACTVHIAFARFGFLFRLSMTAFNCKLPSRLCVVEL